MQANCSRIASVDCQRCNCNCDPSPTATAVCRTPFGQNGDPARKHTHTHTYLYKLTQRCCRCGPTQKYFSCPYRKRCVSSRNVTYRNVLEHWPLGNFLLQVNNNNKNNDSDRVLATVCHVIKDQNQRSLLIKLR